MWLLFAVLVVADTPREMLWASRTESAAVKLRLGTTQLAETAQAIARAGRLGHVAPLRSDADEAVQRANQLVRWAGEAPGVAP